jgi:choline dehydrogenase-like flavoprotein
MKATESSTRSKSTEDCSDLLWDVAIVGTGMGGATVGYALAKAGYRVVFLEKGNAEFADSGESLLLGSDDPADRLRGGSWPTKITGNAAGTNSTFFPPMGCGAGGSTLLYAAALERFEPSDFSPIDGDAPPALKWPVSYEAFVPYYRKAERLYGVRGTRDPLCPQDDSELLEPPPLTECDADFVESLKASGMHPYRVHVAVAYKPGCTECLGHVCPRRCKGDARTICLEPALATGNARLIDRCEVERLDAGRNTVRGIVGQRDGQAVSIRARIVVLAAGAYFSPLLLLKSSNEDWPDGLANASGLVGRNLMFHISDFITVWPRRKLSMTGPRKTIAFRDFYTHAGEKLGSVQSTGISVGYGYVIYFLKNAFDRSRWHWLRPVRPFMRIPAYVASVLFGRATVFATNMEDKPYPENRILLDRNVPGQLRFEYTVHDELRVRIKLMRNLLKRAFARHRSIITGQDVSLNFGHPCGTCRFGSDPSSSVLDANNKAHGLDNLYVVDASFMPTSGGANPSLTIAANALRVADHLIEVLKRCPDEPAVPGFSAARTSTSP